MTQIIEVKPREYVIRVNGHALRQHYFTPESARQAARGLK